MDTDTLFKSIDNAQENCKALFEGTLSSKLLRTVYHPGKYYQRKFNKLVLDGSGVSVVKAKTFWGAIMYVYMFEEPMWYCGIFDGQTEVNLIKFFIKNLQKDDIFFDIGAHHGYYSLLANVFIKDLERIHAFEPTSLHFPLLERTMKNYQGININKLALYSHSGSIDFFEHMKGRSTHGFSEFVKNNPNADGEYKKVTVPCLTLDDYCSEKNIIPSYMKIDVEGSEYDVLLGGKGILEKHKPKIAMEVWSNALPNHKHLEAIDFLSSLGYYPNNIDNDGNLKPLQKINTETDMLPGYTSDNFVFLHK